MFEAPEIDELTGLLSGYEVLELIACGGMGAVYRAEQVSLRRDVAIKVLPREMSQVEEFEKSFKAEARVMARLSHLNLVGVYDFGEVDGMLYLVMEFVNGESLHELAHGKVIDPVQALEIVAGTAAGLGAAHQHQILHRDIKPANILLTQELVPKLGDFGLAVPTDDVGSGLQMGTPGYTAPEVFVDFASATPASDVFSLGMILHELLTGVIPTGEAPANLELVPKLRGLSPLLQKAIDPEPSQRFADGGAMHQALEDWLSDARKLPPHVLIGASEAGSHSPQRLRKPVAANQPVLASSSRGGGSGPVVALVVGAVLVVGIALLFVVNSSKGKSGTANADPNSLDSLLPRANPTDPLDPADPGPKVAGFDLEAHRKDMHSALSRAQARHLEARRDNVEALRRAAKSGEDWKRYFDLVDDRHSELPRHLSAKDKIEVDEVMAQLLNEFAVENQHRLDREHRSAVDALHRKSVAALAGAKAPPGGEVSKSVEAWLEWLGAESGDLVRFGPRSARFEASVTTPAPSLPPGGEGPSPPVGPLPGVDPLDPDGPALEDAELAKLRAQYRDRIKGDLEKWFTSYQERLVKAAAHFGGQNNQAAEAQVQLELERVKGLQWQKGHLAPQEIVSDNSVPGSLLAMKKKLEDHFLRTMGDLQASYVKSLNNLKSRHERAGTDTTEVEQELEPFLQRRRLDLTQFFNARPNKEDWHKDGKDLVSAATSYRSERGMKYEIGGIIQLNSGTYRSRDSETLSGKDLNEHLGKDFPDRITGIPVNQEAKAIFLVGAALWGRAKEGATVARVVFHYADGTVKKHALRARIHLHEWDGGRENQAEDLPGARVLWRGKDGHRIYEIEVPNPLPNKPIATLDLESNKEPFAPFFLAITLD